MKSKILSVYIIISFLFISFISVYIIYILYSSRINFNENSISFFNSLVDYIKKENKKNQIDFENSLKNKMDSMIDTGVLDRITNKIKQNKIKEGYLNTGLVVLYINNYKGDILYLYNKNNQALNNFVHNVLIKNTLKKNDNELINIKIKCYTDDCIILNNSFLYNNHFYFIKAIIIKGIEIKKVFNTILYYTIFLLMFLFLSSFSMLFINKKEIINLNETLKE